MLRAWRAPVNFSEVPLLVLDREARPWVMLPLPAEAETSGAGLHAPPAALKAAAAQESSLPLHEGRSGATLLGPVPVGMHGFTVWVGFSPQLVMALWLGDYLVPLLLAGLLLGGLSLVYSFCRKLMRTLGEREAALEALAVSETRFRDFAGASSDWFWESDPSHRLTWVSQKTGEGRAEALNPLLGRSLINLDCDPEEEEQWQSYQEDLRNHWPFRGLICLLRLNGEERWIRLSGRPVFDTREQFLGYRGTATDIDAQRRAEEQVDKLHRRLARAFEAALDAAAIFDSDDRLVLANQRYKEGFFQGCSDLVSPGLSFDEIPQRLEAAGFRPGRPAVRGAAGAAGCGLARRGNACWRFPTAAIQPWARDRHGDQLQVFADVSDFKRRERNCDWPGCGAGGSGEDGFLAAEP